MHSSVAGQPIPEELSVVNLASGCAFAAMAIGIGASWVLYRNKGEDALVQKIPPRLYQLAFEKWRVDELYAATVVNPIRKVATAAGHVDMTFVDALMTKLPSFNARESGRVLARMQSGVVQIYGSVMAVGVVAIMAWYWSPHARIEAELDGNSAQLTAAQGLGYEYRWDANSDGEFETEWVDQPATSYDYSLDDMVGVAVFIANSRSGVERRVRVTERWGPLPIDAVVPEELIAPQFREFDVRVEGRDLVFRRPKAGVDAPETRLPLGRTGRLGAVRVFSRPLVEATVEVRNAFGNTTSTTQQLALPLEQRGLASASRVGSLHEVSR